MIIRYGEFPLKMTYDDDELNGIIESYILECKKQNQKTFSYKVLCSFLFYEAQCKNKLERETDVIYNSPVMTNEDAIRISHLLWTRIWKRQLFINFHENRYATHYPGDTYFCIL